MTCPKVSRLSANASQWRQYIASPLAIPLQLIAIADARSEQTPGLTRLAKRPEAMPNPGRYYTNTIQNLAMNDILTFSVSS